jgi:hypothetical protein
MPAGRFSTLKSTEEIQKAVDKLASQMRSNLGSHEKKWHDLIKANAMVSECNYNPRESTNEYWKNGKTN